MTDKIHEIIKAIAEEQKQSFSYTVVKLLESALKDLERKRTLEVIETELALKLLQRNNVG